RQGNEANYNLDRSIKATLGDMSSKFDITNIKNGYIFADDITDLATAGNVYYSLEKDPENAILNPAVRTAIFGTDPGLEKAQENWNEPEVKAKIDELKKSTKNTIQ